MYMYRVRRAFLYVSGSVSRGLLNNRLDEFVAHCIENLAKSQIYIIVEPTREDHTAYTRRA